MSMYEVSGESLKKSLGKSLNYYKFVCCEGGDKNTIWDGGIGILYSNAAVCQYIVTQLNVGISSLMVND